MAIVSKRPMPTGSCGAPKAAIDTRKSSRASCGAWISTKKRRYLRRCRRAQKPTANCGKKPNMRVPLLNLEAQYLSIRTEVDAAIRDVMESQHFILGPRVEACERAIANYS